MKFPNYPDYKEAGVDWLDEVPEHWCSLPIKYMALERNSLFLDGDWIESKDISANGIRYITTGNVGEGFYKEQGAGFISDETFHLLDCTDVYVGDVLISRLNAPIGRACVIPELGGRVVTSVDNVIFRPDAKYAKKFIVYLFSSEEYFKHTGNLARGATMQRISRGLLGNIRVVIPPVEEQNQIVRFLDHETARIDALIEEQHRLIELLKEKRQAVISQGVTKGLDPTVPMKDSGVEWLGEVPAHWEITDLKYVVKSIGQGWSPQCDNYPAESGEWGVLKVGCVNGGVFNAAENKRLPDELEPDKELAIKKGDILVSRANTRELVGSAAVAGKDYPWLMLCDKLYRLRLNDQKAYPKFLVLYLGADAPRGEIELSASGASESMQNISQSAIMDMTLPLPQVREQKLIVQFLEEAQKKADKLVVDVKSQLRLLQERRSALISAAVTGKIDVRGWQPPASAPFPESTQEAV